MVRRQEPRAGDAGRPVARDGGRGRRPRRAHDRDAREREVRQRVDHGEHALLRRAGSWSSPTARRLVDAAARASSPTGLAIPTRRLSTRAASGCTSTRPSPARRRGSRGRRRHAGRADVRRRSATAPIRTASRSMPKGTPGSPASSATACCAWRPTAPPPSCSRTPIRRTSSGRGRVPRGHDGAAHLDRAAGRVRNISSRIRRPDLRTAYLGCLLGDAIALPHAGRRLPPPRNCERARWTPAAMKAAATAATVRKPRAAAARPAERCARRHARRRRARRSAGASSTTCTRPATRCSKARSPASSA